MKFLEWVLYIILLPLWLVIGLSWGIWQGFEFGCDMVFGGIWDEDDIDYEKEYEKIRERGDVNEI